MKKYRRAKAMHQKVAIGQPGAVLIRVCFGPGAGDLAFPCRAAVVDCPCVADADGFFAERLLDAEAQVDILGAVEIAGVKTADREEVGFAHHAERRGDGNALLRFVRVGTARGRAEVEDFRRLIKIAPLADRLGDKLNAEMVVAQPPPRLAMIIRLLQPEPDNPDLRVVVELCAHRPDAVMHKGDVVVDKQQALASRLSCPEIVRTRRTKSCPFGKSG